VVSAAAPAYAARDMAKLGHSPEWQGIWQMNIKQHAWANPTKGREGHPPNKGNGKAFRWLMEHVNHQEAVLREGFASGKPTAQIALLIGRPVGAVFKKIGRMGLRSGLE